MKRFFDLNHTPELLKSYDAKDRRGNIEPDFTFINFRQPRQPHHGEGRKDRSDSQNIEKKFRSPIRKRDFSNARIEHSMIASKDYEKEVCYVKLRKIEELLKEGEEDEKKILGKIREIVRSDGKELLPSFKDNEAQKPLLNE